MNNIPSIFSLPDTNCDVTALFARAVIDAARVSPHTYEGIAQRMNTALQTPTKVITANMLTAWLSTTKTTQMPAEYLPALCWAIESIAPMQALLAPLMYVATDQRKQMLQQARELDDQMAMAQERKADILANLGVSDGQ